MKTPMQDLQEKIKAVIEDNAEKNSQFHKGFRYAMGSVLEVVELKLLEDEKKAICDAWECGLTSGSDPDTWSASESIEYYFKTYAADADQR